MPGCLLAVLVGGEGSLAGRVWGGEEVERRGERVGMGLWDCEGKREAGGYVGETEWGSRRRLRSAEAGRGKVGERLKMGFGRVLAPEKNGWVSWVECSHLRRAS